MSTPVTDAARPDAPDVFPPTLREVLVRPRWLGLLALCLVVAGVFAWLGQWQLGRAIQTSSVESGASEQVRPLDEVVKPGAYLPDPLAGQKVSVSGSWVAGDFIVVSSRFQDGAQGYWVTGQLRVAGTSTPTSLAVAVGWTASRSDAFDAAEALDAQVDPAAVVDLAGRIIPDEGAVAPPRGADAQELVRMSSAALLSRWHDIEGLDVYRPFLVPDRAFGGLAAISSPAPIEGSGVNWLNVFYAVEWAVFAGFAFYLWYRLGKDAWEREIEELEESA